MTEGTRVRRLPGRGSYDRATIHSILDQGFVCHLGFVDDRGRPVVIPTAYARVGQDLYLHGAPANAALGVLAAGVAVCVTVTLVDGLVLARSAFHHSINYRSVVIFSNATGVRDLDEKRIGLAAIVEHILPGRGADARPPSVAELRATRVVRVPIDKASAKVRSGGPNDDDADLGLGVWAGQVPLHTVAGDPVAAHGIPADLAPPGYATGCAREMA